MRHLDIKVSFLSTAVVNCLFLGPHFMLITNLREMTSTVSQSLKKCVKKYDILHPKHSLITPRLGQSPLAE